MILALAMMGILYSFEILCLQQLFGTIAPLEQIVGGTLGFILSEVCFAMLKFIPVQNKRTGKTKYYALGEYLSLR